MLSVIMIRNHIWHNFSQRWEDQLCLGLGFNLQRCGRSFQWLPMRQVPLERDINIAVNDPFLVEVINQEWAIYCNEAPASFVQVSFSADYLPEGSTRSSGRSPWSVSRLRLAPASRRNLKLITAVIYMTRRAAWDESLAGSRHLSPRLLRNVTLPEMAGVSWLPFSVVGA